MPLFRRRPPAPPDWAAPLDAAQFAQFTQHLDLALKHLGPYELDDGWAVMTQSPMRYGLSNVMQKWRLAEPGQRAAVVAEHMANLISAEDAPLPEGDELLALLRPRVWPAAGGAGDVEGVSTFARPVADGVEAVLSIDLPTTVRTLGEDVAAATGLSADALWDIALDQLDDGLPLEQRDAGDGIIGLFGDSFFVASRILDLERVTGPLPDDGALVAIPNRHTLLVHPIESTAVIPALNRMAILAYELEAEGPGSISDAVLWWRDDELVRIPARVEETQLVLSPPDALVEVLNRLADEASE